MHRMYMAVGCRTQVPVKHCHYELELSVKFLLYEKLFGGNVPGPSASHAVV
jgi:hypothetical protein